MAERSKNRERDDVNRSRGRKSDEERRPQHIVPQLYINSNVECPQHGTFSTQDFGYIIDPEEDVIIRDVFPGLSYGLLQSASAKPGSTTSIDGTLLSVGLPSVMTEDGTGSFVNIYHKRTYSDNSFGSSNGTFDHPQYSTPDEEGCLDDADVTTHTAVSETVTACTPHDAQYVLSSLASRQPRTIPDPYRTDNFSNDNDTEYNDSSQYVFRRSNGLQEISTSTESSRTRNGFEAPWNHVQNQVSQYPPGYVAFAPAPGPALESFSYDLRIPGVASGLSPTPSLASSPSTRSRRSSWQSRRSSKDRRKAPPYTWEHRTVSNDGLKIIVQDEDTGPKHRKGRQGKLAPETAEKALRIRRMKACWNCWIQKTSCSEGSTCDKCRRFFSPISDQICCRSGFKDYLPIFFPEFLHSHLKKRQIERLISENISQWGQQTIRVEVSTGEVFKPMVLRVNDFRSQLEFLLHPRLTQGEPRAQLQPQPLRLQTPYGVPVGIMGLDMDDMKKKCNKHIEEMISNKRYADQVTAGDPNPIPRRILEIALRFRSTSTKGKEIPLVRNALKLHAFHYFMGSLMSFTEESASDIYKVMLYNGIPGPELSSRLLNRQVKYIMHKLHRELTETVLKDLEKSLRSRTKDAWAPLFCSILVLCLCIESLQTAAHTMIVCEFQKPDPSPEYSRDQSKTACVELDEHPFSKSTKLFHDIYRTHKDHFSGPRDGAFNPLMAVHDGVDTNLNPAADEMVKSVYKMTHENYHEVSAMAEKTPAVDLGHAIQPQTIKESNTGRLASKFLKSFFTET